MPRASGRSSASRDRGRARRRRRPGPRPGEAGVGHDRLQARAGVGRRRLGHLEQHAAQRVVDLLVVLVLALPGELPRRARPRRSAPAGPGSRTPGSSGTTSVTVPRRRARRRSRAPRTTPAARRSTCLRARSAPSHRGPSSAPGSRPSRTRWPPSHRPPACSRVYGASRTPIAGQEVVVGDVLDLGPDDPPRDLVPELCGRATSAAAARRGCARGRRCVWASVRPMFSFALASPATTARPGSATWAPNRSIAGALALRVGAAAGIRRAGGAMRHRAATWPGWRPSRRPSTRPGRT